MNGTQTAKQGRHLARLGPWAVDTLPLISNALPPLNLLTCSCGHVVRTCSASYQKSAFASLLPSKTKLSSNSLGLPTHPEFQGAGRRRFCGTTATVRRLRGTAWCLFVSRQTTARSCQTCLAPCVPAVAAVSAVCCILYRRDSHARFRQEMASTGGVLRSLRLSLISVGVF